MHVFTNVNAANSYDDFKVLVAQLASDAHIFYVGSTNLKSIYAVVKGDPGCKGEFPIALSTGGADLSSFSISITGTVLVDFPSAVEVKNLLNISV